MTTRDSEVVMSWLSPSALHAALYHLDLHHVLLEHCSGVAVTEH